MQSTTADGPRILMTSEKRVALFKGQMEIKVGPEPLNISPKPLKISHKPERAPTGRASVVPTGQVPRCRVKRWSQRIREAGGLVE